jgi:hypothetical protein
MYRYLSNIGAFFGVMTLAGRAVEERRAFLQLGGNYILNNSNLRIFNYHVFTGGPSATLNIQW